jgi:NAD(P)-dependent dehydrogenase (short-subunit alcohol dehydrogenase family)
MDMKSKVILITGASRGLGKIWAETFLKRGDKVIATARNIDSLADLVSTYGQAILPIQLNVNDREQCFAAVKRGNDYFGGIDVLINNAGYGLFGLRRNGVVSFIIISKEAQRLNITVFPTNFLLDESGKIIRKDLSPVEVRQFLSKNL